MATATKRKTKSGTSGSAKPPKISAEWRKLMALIPGYDAIATAPPGYWFDDTAAADAIGFFKDCLRHVKGHKGGQPFLLEPWQQAVTGCIFGWKRPDGLRRYQEIWYYVPRKNGKSPWAGGIVLYLMINDPEPGIEAYSGACDRDQAALVYQYVQGMILQEPLLKSRLKVYSTTKVVEYPDRFAYYKVLSAIPESKHGLNVHCAVIDETHAHRAPDLIDVLSTGTAARKQPLIIHTTTADWQRESVCNEKYEYACKVRDGVIQDAAFLPVIYEAKEPPDEEKDPLWWTKEAVWRQANPNYGVSVEPDFLKRECQRALDMPRFRNTFKRLHLNIRTGQDTAWFGLEAWDACYAPGFDWDSLQGQPCYAGIDLASTSDLAACVLYFPDSHAVLPYFWLPHDTIAARYERAGVPYPLWTDQGHIRVTPGNQTDYDFIRMDITTRAEAKRLLATQRYHVPHGERIADSELDGYLLLGDQYHIVEIAIDRWNSTQLQTQLAGDGFTVVPYGQGFASMAAPCKELERLITGKLLRHNGHPVMRWMASHVATEEDAAGNLKPAKNRSAEKIDGIVALAMAIGRALVAEPLPGPSVYERRGALIL